MNHTLLSGGNVYIALELMRISFNEIRNRHNVLMACVKGNIRIFPYFGAFRDLRAKSLHILLTVLRIYNREAARGRDYFTPLFDVIKELSKRYSGARNGAACDLTGFNFLRQSRLPIVRFATVCVQIPQVY